MGILEWLGAGVTATGWIAGFVAVVKVWRDTSRLSDEIQDLGLNLLAARTESARFEADAAAQRETVARLRRSLAAAKADIKEAYDLLAENAPTGAARVALVGLLERAQARADEAD